MPRLLLFMFLACFRADLAYAETSYPIAAPRVLSVVLAAHPELAGDAIEVPARVGAHEAEPALVAGAVERWPASSPVARVRLHCQGEGVCLPFYALVHLSASETASGTQPRSGTLPGPAAHTLGTQAGSAMHVDAPVLRTGQRASMLIDSGLLHLRIPVTCLQGGAVGSTIRVAGPGRSKIFEAAVLDGTTVRGSL